MNDWRQRFRFWWAMNGEEELWRFVIGLVTFVAMVTLGAVIYRVILLRGTQKPKEDTE